MTEPNQSPDPRSHAGSLKPAAPAEPERDVMVDENPEEWADPVCACEAEPYWQAIQEAEENEEPDNEPC